MTGKNRHNHLYSIPGHGHTEKEVNDILDDAIFQASFNEADPETSPSSGEHLSSVVELLEIGQHLADVRRVEAA